jgi:drug/metabolite transporter (DMT)-like permease
VGQWSAVWAGGAQAVTYLCFFEIIRRAGPVFFAQLNYVVVAAGLIWARLLFHEVLSLWVWGALALMVGGLLLANAGTAQAQRLAARRD